LIEQTEKAAERAEPKDKVAYVHYLQHSLLPMRGILEKCTLIQRAKPLLARFKPGDRALYREIFHPTTRPNFMLTRFMVAPPKRGECIESYKVNGITVDIFRLPGRATLLYHITPPEFVLDETKSTILDDARRYLAARRPTETEVAEPERAREIFASVGRDLIGEIARSRGVELSPKEVEELTQILIRYTAGFGVLELLLADERVQDIYINAPIGATPIYVYHADYEECETNLTPTMEDAEAWATRFRLYSGRPLDEANPVLDTELLVPGGRARVCAITRTLSPYGLAFTFRRHRARPWTFPLFMQVKFFDPLFAGLMSFLIDGGRAMLIAGGRSSGKTSFLGSMISEILPKFRIIVSEDTLEIPVPEFRRLGYNINRLKTRSVITRVETEVAPEEALRTALRLGESVLIVGEVRSWEAKALFEAMRIGALANVVAGTIHGESPYAVYDRVVHDLGVPPASFKAIDLIVTCMMLRSPDGLRRFRRIVELTEVKKVWKEDPLAEGAFVPLMEYSAKEDRLKPTPTLLEGESEILNAIARRVREWRGRWDAMWDNILLRAKIKDTTLKLAEKLNRAELLEAEWVVRSNQAFHLFCEEVLKEVGSLDSKLIYERWLGWLKKELK
jgi:type IV secretory pathway ATPase VirB11/archaellum biosynthesis ATPase